MSKQGSAASLRAVPNSNTIKLIAKDKRETMQSLPARCLRVRIGCCVRDKVISLPSRSTELRPYIRRFDAPSRRAHCVLVGTTLTKNKWRIEFDAIQDLPAAHFKGGQKVLMFNLTDVHHSSRGLSQSSRRRSPDVLRAPHRPKAHARPPGECLWREANGGPRFKAQFCRRNGTARRNSNRRRSPVRHLSQNLPTSICYST